MFTQNWRVLALKILQGLCLTFCLPGVNLNSRLRPSLIFYKIAQFILHWNFAFVANSKCGSTCTFLFNDRCNKRRYLNFFGENIYAACLDFQEEILTARSFQFNTTWRNYFSRLIYYLCQMTGGAVKWNAAQKK